MRKVQAEKCIEAAKILAKEKPLTIDEKIRALGSLRDEPKAGQVLYWPNSDGIDVPMDPHGFWGSIVHNWR